MNQSWRRCRLSRSRSEAGHWAQDCQSRHLPTEKMGVRESQRLLSPASGVRALLMWREQAVSMCHYFRHSGVGGEKGRGQLGWQRPLRGRNPLLCTSRDLPRASWTCSVGGEGTARNQAVLAAPSRQAQCVRAPRERVLEGCGRVMPPWGLASWSCCWESREPGPDVWERKIRSVWVGKGKLGQAGGDRRGGRDNQR